MLWMRSFHAVSTHCAAAVTRGEGVSRVESVESDSASPVGASVTSDLTNVSSVVAASLASVVMSNNHATGRMCMNVYECV